VIRVAERPRLPGLWWSAGLASGCVALGVLTGYKPEYGLLAVIGLAFGAVVIADLTIGFVAFTALSFLDLFTASGSFSGTKVIGALLFASWIARLSTLRRSGSGSFTAENPWLTAALLAMLGWSALSFTWAFSPHSALTSTLTYALDMTLIPIAFAAVRERRHVVWVLIAFVAGTVLSCIYGFLNPAGEVSGFTGRLTGSFGDPNAEASVLAASIPLLISLASAYRDSARMKLVAVIGVAIMFLGLVSTLSREGLVAFAAVMVAAVVFGGRWRRRAAVLLALGVLATGGYYFVLAPLAARQRVTMSDTSGRTTLWTVAWRVVKAHPLLGVGQNNFILVEAKYIDEAGLVNAYYIIDNPKVAHDAYLEALADLGFPGLLTFLAVLGFCIGAAVRAVRIFERIDDVQMELMARALVLALVAILTADLFVSSAIAKFLWLPLAMCPVMLAVARRARAELQDGVPTQSRVWAAS
jgi:O-antigen ligase